MLDFARYDNIYASDFCLWKSVFFRQKSVLHRLSGQKSSFFQRHKLQKKAAGIFSSNLNFLLDYKAISPYGDRNANGAGSSLRCSFAPTDALDSVHATFAVIADAVNATNSVN